MKTPVKIGLIVGAVVLAAAAGLAVLGLGIDPTLFSGQIAGMVKATTGLDVAFGGSIRIRYFPTLRVELNQVTVNAPKEAGGGALAKLGKADVSVKVLPLLSGRVEAGEMDFDGLEVNLVRDEKGRLNLPLPPVKEVKIEGQQVVVITDADERYAIDYRIEGVKLTNSRFSFDDRVTRNKLSVWDLSLSTGSVARGKAFPVKLGFAYGLAEPEASGTLELSGQAMAVPEALRFAFENASFKTTLGGKGLPVKSIEAQYTGTIRVDADNRTFTGEKLKFKAMGKGGLLPDAGAGFSLDMDAKTDLKAGTGDITGLVLDVMGLQLSGGAHATGLGQALKVTADLTTNEFNPKQILEKFGVAVQDSGTAMARFKADVDMAAGTATVSEAKVKAMGLDVAAQLGITDLAGVPDVKGKVAIAECNPRQIMEKLGRPLPASADPSALTKFQMAYTFEGRGDTFSMRTDSFKLDNTAMFLAMNALKGPRPKVSFTFKADDLDADRYTPKASSEKTAPAKSEQAKPLNVAADVDGTVQIGKLKAAKLHLRDVSAKVSLKDNILDLNPAQVSLYQGTARASLRADVRGGPNAPLAASVDAQGVQVEPLLMDLEGKARISGRANLNAQVTAKGQEARQVLSSLNGKASFAVRNGAILGFDFSPDVFSSPEKLLAQGKGPARTNFEVISGSFTLVNGVAHGNDLLALVPPHRVTGQGWVNLASETLDYRVQASFVKLPPIPVHLTGSLASPSVSVDAAGLATGVAKGVVDTVVKTPQEVIKAPQSIGKGALDAVGNILGLPRK